MRTCPREPVNEPGIYWDTGEGDNSRVIDKGAGSFSSPPIDLAFGFGT